VLRVSWICSFLTCCCTA